MPLADTLPPERIILSLRQNRIGIHTVQGKHTRIPANRDQRCLSCLFCRRIHRSKMLRYPGMRVKTVYHMKHLRILRRLFRKIRSASAADDHHIDPVLPLPGLTDSAHLCCFCKDLYILRISSGKYCQKFHIRILTDGAFHAPSQISIAQNSNSDTHLSILLLSILLL